MKKKLTVFISAVSAISLILSGCSEPAVDVVINADGYEGILLATQITAAPLISISVINSGEHSAETASDGSESRPEEITTENEATTEQEQAPVTVNTPPEPVTAAPQPVITVAPEVTAATTAYIEVTTTTTTTPPEVTTSLEEDPPNTDLTPIMGTSIATVEQMRAFIKAINPDVDQRIIDMIPYYLSEGEAEGVRGDIAFAQSCVETGYFRFEKAGTGSAVTIDDNNFCGLGVTQLGIKGCIFETPQLGIRAQIQHLKAYGSTLPLNGEQVDPRFHYVVRGCAKYWEWLGMQENPEGRGWAGGKNYGPIILDIFYKVLEY